VCAVTPGGTADTIEYLAYHFLDVDRHTFADRTAECQHAVDNHRPRSPAVMVMLRSRASAPSARRCAISLPGSRRGCY
jgi:hypothetical protein